MSQKEIRGALKEQEIRHDTLVRDTRGAFKKMSDWLTVPTNLATLLIFFAALAFMVPAIADICLIATGFLTWFGLTRKEMAPLKLPIQSQLLDLHERNPGNGKPEKAKGIFFLGNEIKTGKEVWLTNSDCRQHFLVLGTTGAGKALPLDANVHTPAGWVKMGDLKVGDFVSTPDGKSSRIIGYYPQGEIEICRIKFADGRVAEACPEHLWEIHHKHWNGRYKKGESRAGNARPRLLRTREIAELIKRNKGAFKIRLAEPVEKPATAVPIDPYLLGALIGDGNVSSKILRFSSADEYIVTKVSGLLENIGHQLHQDDYPAACDYRVRNSVKSGGTLSCLRSALSDLGLEGMHSWEKFIPEVYKQGSVAQRWAVIQGLMDTDGSADSRHGSLSFSTTSEKLARDFQEVVWSLGGIAKIKSRVTHYRGADGELKEGRPSWHVSIRHRDPSQFFSLPRKVALTEGRYQYADNLKLQIVSIETVRRADAACILIDHPEHLFITDNYVVTHNTEALLGFAANAVAWGSGFLFCDGKGDVALFSKVYALCRRFGREDDLLVLNYMTGNQDLGASGGVLRSNTLNPFATGSSDTLTQMVVGLMDDAGGDGAMWKGRATAMFTGVMRALTYLRDSGIIDLNVSEIRDHLQLKRIIDLADKSKYPDLPQPIRKSILSYMTSLPGFQEDKGYKQSQTTLDQHGYLEMQFTKILGSLADVYGHIFHTPYGEIDMNDVVLNRRILVIMLPALEKSGDEIANLGKIVVATLKGMMGGTLGSQIEGSWAKIVDNRVTNSESPFIVVLDEVGYYMVDGMDLMSAQARSLGFSLIFAGQDINAMKRLNEKVFGSVQGNTNTKIIMRTEDPDTAKIAVEGAGKTNRAVLKQYKGQNKEIGGRAYSDNMEAGVEEVDRVNPLDLKAQDEGEMHIIHKEWLVRAKSFYANPEGSVNKRNLRLRANHFITVARPDPEEIQSQQKLPEIVQKMADPDFAKTMKIDAEKGSKDVSGDNEICEIARTLLQVSNSTRRKSTSLEASCIALGKVVSTSRDVNAAYSEKVNTSVGRGSQSRMPDDIVTPPETARPRPTNRPDRPERPDRTDGFVGRDMGIPHLPDEFEQPERPRSDRPLITKEARPFGPGRMRDVKHGAKVDGGAIHEMSDRLSSNDSVIRTLQALNFDERAETKEMVDSGIEEALLMDDDDEFFDDIPFDVNEVNEAAGYVSSAIPEFEDDEDEGGEAEQDGNTINQFIFSLLDDDDEKAEEKK